MTVFFEHESLLDDTNGQCNTKLLLGCDILISTLDLQSLLGMCK